MSQHAWFEHFKERLQGLTEAFEQSGTSMSLLGYALSQNLLNADDYIAWAVNHYKLPLLQKRFFTETPPSLEMFAKWATHYPWSSECLPVAEWDGALIVACLQPPQDFPTSPSCILVLSSYEGLEQTWSKIREANKVTPAVSTPAVHAATKPASEMPEGIDITMPVSAEAKKSSDTFSFDDLDAGSSESSAPKEDGLEGLEENAEPSEALDGLFDAPTVVKLEALSGGAPALEKTSHEPAVVAPKAESFVKSDATATTPLLTPLTPLMPAEPVTAKPATPPPTPAIPSAPAATVKPAEPTLKVVPPPVAPVKTAPPPQIGRAHV